MRKFAVITMVVAIHMGLGGCKSSPADTMSDPVVTIEDKVLTIKELQDAIPDNMSKEDSAVFAQDFINRWVKTELMLRKAELNLTPTEKDVDKLLEEYRTSLLTHLYQQKLLEQKYAPLITSSEIEAYYIKMSENFKLSHPIVKGLFIKIPKTAPRVQEIERLYRSDKPADLVELEAYCYQYAKKFDLFIDNWRPLSSIEQELPRALSDGPQTFKYQHHYQTQDIEFLYFISVRQIMFEDELAPMEFVNSNIKSILLNKKRIEFIKKLEEDLYDEALKQKVVKFH